MSSVTEHSGITAVVHDFICLFTHDLKRKQKRWQDGKLTYHCFNKKLMVYDDRGNFIGESHWQEDGDLEDGCELSLERGGALVQVAERIGSHTQDLTDLVEKRAKDVESRRASKAGRVIPVGTSTPHASRHAPVHAHHLQRPLASLVASPGPIGRAIVPAVSPYEARVSGRGLYKVAEPRASSKRQRSVSPPSKMGHARALFGTQLTLSASPLNLSQARRSVLSQRAANIPPSGPSTEEMRGGKDPSPDVIELSSVDHKTSAERNGRVVRRREPVAQEMTRQIILDDSPEPSPESQLHLTSGHGLHAQVVKGSNPERLPPHTDVRGYACEGLQAKPLQEKSKPRNSLKRTRSPSLGVEVAVKRKQLEDETRNQTHNISVASPSLVPRQSQSKHVVDLAEQMSPEISAPTTSKQSTGAASRSEKKLAKSHDEEIGPIIAKSRAEAERAPQLGERDTLSEATTVLKSQRIDSRGDGPRTELRIRPRQRRGLLMVSERTPKSLPKPAATANLGLNKWASEDAHEIMATGDELSGVREEIRQTTRAPKDVNLDEQDKHFEDWLEAESIDPSKGAIAVTPESRTKAKPSASKAQSRAKRKAKASVEELADREERQGTTSNGEDESIEGAVQKKGPRIARMARKSVKSKEIIGFVPEPGVGLQMPFANQNSYMGKSFEFNSTSDSLGQPTDASALEIDTDASVVRRADAIVEEGPGVPEGQQLSKVRQEASPTPRENLTRPRECSEERLPSQTLPGSHASSRITNMTAVPHGCSPPMAVHLLQEEVPSPLETGQSGHSKDPSGRPVSQPRDQESDPTPLMRSVRTIDAKQHHLENEPSISGSTIASPAQASMGTGRLSSYETPGVFVVEETALSRNASTGSQGRASEPSSSNHGRKSSGARQISNPATRGRKAAAKKDAAGMAPRTLVQLDPPRPAFTRKVAPAAATAITTSGPSPVATNLASAFTAASGGAWSKHAGDLLGMSRPDRGVRQ